MSDKTLTDEAADAQRQFRQRIWKAVAAGEMNQLTKREMSIVLDEVADCLERESVSRSGWSSNREIGDKLEREYLQ